jgi:hypothetical protein
MTNCSTQREDELRSQVIVGCIEMGSFYEEIDEDWNQVSDEAWRGIEQPSVGP